jgi:hypothetical protein
MLSFQVAYSSFVDVDYVESYSGTDVSFVQRHEVSNLTKKDLQVSSDTLDKLDVSVKCDVIRTWIENTSIFKMNN